MTVLAFIPARGGSKRLPGKNLAMVGGCPLVGRAVVSASYCDRVVVSTDSEEVWQAARPSLTAFATIGVHERHERPAPLASDSAQIEDALAHWWTRAAEKPDVVVLLQPTSPLRTAQHVREAVQLLRDTDADSVVSVTLGHEHHFAGRLKPRDDLGGAMEWSPFRDVLAERPRTQDLRPVGAENGAIYVFTRRHWERTSNRLGGRMVAYPMDRWHSIDVDTEEDLRVARLLAEDL